MPKFHEMTDLEFWSLLNIVNENNGEQVKTKTQADLRRFDLALGGKPCDIPEGWEPFDDAAYDELLGKSSPFMAGLMKEARKRFLALQTG